MRFLSTVATIGLLIVASVFPAHAQESTKELAAKASAELQLLTAFQSLERMASQMNHFLVYAIQAERGGWEAREFNNVPEGASANFYIIHATAEDLQVDVARANRTIVKSKVAIEDELKGAETILESMGSLLNLAPQIADMVKAGELDAATALYRKSGHPAYESALRSAQSSVGTVSSRLGKTLLDIRIAK